MDISKVLNRRVVDLLEARPEVSRAEFGRAIGRTSPSWCSEFLNGKRTTDSLRLVLRMAKFFSVPIGYLLDQPGHKDQSPQTAALLHSWEGLDSEQRDVIARLAVSLHRLRGPSDTGPDK